MSRLWAQVRRFTRACTSRCPVSHSREKQGATLRPWVSFVGLSAVEKKNWQARRHATFQTKRELPCRDAMTPFDAALPGSRTSWRRRRPRGRLAPRAAASAGADALRRPSRPRPRGATAASAATFPAACGADVLRGPSRGLVRRRGGAPPLSPSLLRPGSSREGPSPPPLPGPRASDPRLRVAPRRSRARAAATRPRHRRRCFRRACREERTWAMTRCVATRYSYRLQVSAGAWCMRDRDRGRYCSSQIWSPNPKRVQSLRILISLYRSLYCMYYVQYCTMTEQLLRGP